MTQDIKTAFGSLTEVTVTNLASLALNTWWQSGRITKASPTFDVIEVFWEIVYTSTPSVGAYLWFKLLSGDGGSLGNEIWDGDIGSSEGQITSAAAVAAVDQTNGPAWTHPWGTSHGATFKGSRRFPLVSQDFQILVSPKGNTALALSGHRIRYRLGNSQLQ